jgi:hypothetical protein
MHEDLDACGPCIGKQVAVMRVRAAQSMDHMREQALGASAHVYWLRAQPQRVDADHRNTSRSHAAQSAAAETGQVTLTPSVPRLNLRRMSSASVTAGADVERGAEGGDGEGSDSAMNWGVESATVVGVAGETGFAPRPRRH